MGNKIILALFCLYVGAATALPRNLDESYEKDKFAVGGTKISAYVADDDGHRAQGLMFISSLPEDVGMVFVFDEPQVLKFWMKNTVMDLSIGYFDKKGRLIDVQEMKATSVMDVNPPTYPSSGPAVFALEMNPDWFTRHKLKKGARLQLVGLTKSSLLKRQMRVVKSSGQ